MAFLGGLVEKGNTMGNQIIDNRLTKEQIKRYDQWMDSECVPLCDALNNLPGIETFESCCGHGKSPFMIFFIAEGIEDLLPVLVEIHDRREWRLEVQWANGGGQIYFMLKREYEDFNLTLEESKSIAKGLGE
jgi:hypothetical protein